MAEAQTDRPSRFRAVWHKLMTGNSLIITYLRSIVSSQAASWVDYLVCFLLKFLTSMSAFWATAAGAFCGGVVNCIINYKFTFRAEGCDWRTVVVKYVCVWVGSLLLNSYGTQAASDWVATWQWPAAFGISADALFVPTRLLVSLLVSWFWNFGLQRYFVYRPVPADRFILRLFGDNHSSNKKDNGN